MSNESFLAMVVGLMFGAFLVQLSLVFFEREIFGFMDRLVTRVRNLFGLKP